MFGILSHAHLAILLRAIWAGAKWQVPTADLTQAQLATLQPLCDPSTGLLMLSAVAEHDAVAKKLVTEGMLFEVLHRVLPHSNLWHRLCTCHSHSAHSFAVLTSPIDSKLQGRPCTT